MSDKYLVHYASPYYDPVKAHEYYIKNRELKGRMSTAKLNEEGKKVADYVKYQLTSERMQKENAHKEQTDSQIESLRANKASTIEAHKEHMQMQISNLKAKLASMTKREKRANLESINNQIDSLRNQNALKREELQNQFKANSTSLRENHKVEKARLRSEYDNKYADELDKIRSESKYTTQSNSKTTNDNYAVRVGDKLYEKKKKEKK